MAMRWPGNEEHGCNRTGRPGRAIAWRIVILAIPLLVALLGLSVMSASPPDAPPPRVQCTECHEGFVPFTYSVEAPTEAPVGEDFLLRVTVTNDGAHTVVAPTAVLTVDDPAGMSVETGGPQVQKREEQGSFGLRGSASFTMSVQAGAQGASLVLDGSGGPMDELGLTVTGPDGGSWTATGAGTDKTLELDAGAIATGGNGDYQVVVDHTRGVRRVTFTLTLEVAYGAGTSMLVGPDLDQGGSVTMEFTMLASQEGPNAVSVTVSGTCEYTHSSGDEEVETFDYDERVPIEVGDELVYGARRDGGGASGWEDALAGGRYLGFVSAALLATSILASGRAGGLPRRARLHCASSILMLPVILVHWTMLWLGPYGATFGGIVTGPALLATVALLAVTGARPALLDGKVLALPSKRLHRLLVLVVVVVLVVHAVALGTDLAFLRGGL